MDDLDSLDSIFEGTGQSEVGITVTIGANVEYIPEHLFNGCRNLKTVIFAEGSICTKIGAHSFYYCDGLSQITIPESVTYIGFNAFDGCTALTEVYYTGTINDWCQIDFDSTPSNPMYYAKSLFIDGINYYEESSIDLNETTKISSYAFYGFANLSELTIGENVQSIGTLAFWNCTALTKINFNAINMKDLDESTYAFSYAGQEEVGITVKIGANVKKYLLICFMFRFHTLKIIGQR